ncbi:MAG TPA: amidohydrolase [Micropepsaceae bacterium]|nr:amidohydrolase [Micropepsaceae bacterium]
MKTWLKMAVAAAALAMAMGTPAALAQGQAPDTILTNGKIITVYNRFSIAQAVAVTGDRIMAVGTNAEINRLAGPNTRRIDLGGKSVVPGMIDDHAHIMEEGRIWLQELRLDGITTRKAALEMIRAKAATLKPGEWVYVLGGFTVDQFTDNKKDFTREELDAVAPNNPVQLQFTRCCTYVNSRTIAAMGLDTKTDPWIQRDASGRPTGIISVEGAGAISRARPEAPDSIYESGAMALMKDMNKAGLTTVGGPCPNEDIDAYRKWASEGRSSVRFYCNVSIPARNPMQADATIAKIPALKKEMYQGNSFFDFYTYGEHLYQPVGDNMVAVKATAKPEDFAVWGRIARELAKNGLSINQHATLEGSIDGFLDQIEQINKDYPVKNLRWTLIHLDQLTPAQIERMKKLGMYAGVQPRSTIMGGIFHRVHGTSADHTPPFKTIQDSGIMWGLGTDAFEVNQYRPFTTLGFAVTGKMVGGTVVNNQTVSREDALIAHTRSNAYFLFQEDNLGSIQPGKLADLVVLDRDYLTVPADQIKDIQPVLTMVGGKIGWDASAQTAAR